MIQGNKRHIRRQDRYIRERMSQETQEHTHNIALYLVRLCEIQVLGGIVGLDNLPICTFFKLKGTRILAFVWNRKHRYLFAFCVCSPN